MAAAAAAAAAAKKKLLKTAAGSEVITTAGFRGARVAPDLACSALLRLPLAPSPSQVQPSPPPPPPPPSLLPFRLAPPLPSVFYGEVKAQQSATAHMFVSKSNPNRVCLIV
uniref:Uncharacterized protein n=1 Tax=Oryza meridionalis TaxID=40149 RepID=A0A0E0D8D2_9ORYZ